MRNALHASSFCVLAMTLLAAACGGPDRAAVPGAASASAPASSTSLELRCGPDEPAPMLTIRGGTARDHALACTALQRALAFFDSHGLAPDRRVVVEFRQAVFWEHAAGSVSIDATAPLPVQDASRNSPDSAERVAGLFDPVRNAVLMTTEAQPWLRSYTYFGAPMRDEMMTAMLTHEIVHALSRSLHAAALRAPEADLRVQKECVAYVVQLATLAPTLRAEILERFPAEPRDGDEAAINALALDLAPEAFGVLCFRHFTSDAGGTAFLRRLYSGDFIPPTLF